MSARSCSLACRLFFKRDALVLETAPHRPVACRRTALGQLGHHRPQEPAPAKAGVRSGFSAIRANNHARSPVSRSGRRPPIGLAAALPVARQRCDHLTTLATLTPNSAAVARQVRPPATAATTRSRRSCESGLAIRCWPPTPASILNHKTKCMKIVF